MWMYLGIYKTWTLVIINRLKHFGLWFRSNELLLLVGRIIIIFGIGLTSPGDLGLLGVCLD